MRSHFIEPVYRTKSRNVLVFCLLLIVLLLLAILNISVGAVPIAWGETVRAFLGSADPDLAHIILHYRLPRVVLALLVGAGLSVSGLISQAVLLNPLAAPDTLGISAGAALGAVCILLLLPPETQSVWLVTVTAFAGGGMGAFLVYILSYRNGLSPVRLALVGIAVSACASTGVQLLLTQSSMNTSTVLLWLNGSLWGRSWEQVVHIIPLIVILIPVVWMLARAIDILSLGDETSTGLGIRIELLRMILLLLTVLLASGSVAVVGMIGFIGLVSPHMARKLVKGGHRVYIPAAMLIGSILLLLADTLGRAIAPPLEFPAGLITSIIGGPYFLYLLWREYRTPKR